MLCGGGSQASGATIEVASFGLGGWLVQLLSAPLAVLVDAVSFLFSAICLLGIRTPEPISKLQQERPNVYKQLMDIRQALEKHYKEMQDIEFTVQDGTLYMLQTRSGKRTGTAAGRIARRVFPERSSGPHLARQLNGRPQRHRRPGAAAAGGRPDPLVERLYRAVPLVTGGREGADQPSSAWVPLPGPEMP